MAKSNLYSRSLFMVIAICCLSLASCKTPVSAGAENKDSNNMNESEDSGMSMVYLMVRLVKQKDGTPGVIAVERNISKRQGNALPVPESGARTNAFKCELIGTDGSTISTTTQNASYQYGEKENEAILKFLLPVADEIKEARVSYQTREGWEVLLIEEMKEY